GSAPDFLFRRLNRLIWRQPRRRGQVIAPMRPGAGADRLALFRRHGPRAARRAVGADALLLGRRDLVRDVLRVLAARRLLLLVGGEGGARARNERYYEKCAHTSLLAAHAARRVPGTHFARILSTSLSQPEEKRNA